MYSYTFYEHVRPTFTISFSSLPILKFNYFIEYSVFSNLTISLIAFYWNLSKGFNHTNFINLTI
jgi:hypothetical protein